MKFFICLDIGCNWLRPNWVPTMNMDWEGKYDVVYKMIKAGAATGADAVKFQYYNTEEIIQYENDHPPSKYTRETLDLIKETELTVEDLYTFRKMCDQHRVEFMCTPFINPLRVKEVDSLVQRHKIRARDNKNEPLIRAAVETGKQVIVSRRDYEFEWVNLQLKQVYCIPEYPASIDDIDHPQGAKILEAMDGYSNHIPSVAQVLGLCAIPLWGGYQEWFYLELHFKLENTTPVDDAVSFTSAEVTRIVDTLREWEKIKPKMGAPFIAL